VDPFAAPVVVDGVYGGGCDGCTRDGPLDAGGGEN